MDLSVEVVFRNIVIGSSTDTPGIATPVDSFTLGTFEYGVDLNGELYIMNSSATGDQYRYLIDKDLHKWRYSADETGSIVKEDLGVVTGSRTFWIMIDADNFIWLIGSDLNGEFDSQYLQ